MAVVAVTVAEGSYPAAKAADAHLPAGIWINTCGPTVVRRFWPAAGKQSRRPISGGTAPTVFMPLRVVIAMLQLMIPLRTA